MLNSSIIEVNATHLSKLQEIIKKCKVKHGPFLRLGNLYRIPVKNGCGLTVILLALSESNIKLI